MITIRVATAEDAELIADMSRQTFHDSFAAQNTAEDMDKFMTEQFSRDELIREVKMPKNIFLLAYDGDEPVGYVRMRENNNPPELGPITAIEIARIYAVASAIGKGVGRALMNACLQTARQKHCDAVWLGVWEHNARALSFYNKWGFEKFSSHPFILGNDVQTDWLLKKNLS